MQRRRMFLSALATMILAGCSTPPVSVRDTSFEDRLTQRMDAALGRIDPIAREFAQSLASPPPAHPLLSSVQLTVRYTGNASDLLRFIADRIGADYRVVGNPHTDPLVTVVSAGTAQDALQDVARKIHGLADVAVVTTQARRVRLELRYR